MSQFEVMPGAASLAEQADLEIGGVTISPSLGLVSCDGRSERVPPLVMQVLLTLLRGEGRTVSHEQLVEACWGGRIVTSDAIMRQVALVRSLAKRFDPPPFLVKTIPKVGYRLEARCSDTSSAGISAGRPSPSPRRLYGWGLVLTAALAAVLFAWVWNRREAPARDRIVVAPFETLQSNPALERLSTALGLSIVRGLGDTGIPTILAPGPARAWGGDLRVVGAVDRDATRFVVHAQVLGSDADLVLWSGRFERELAAPEGFAEEIANRVADTLDCALWRKRVSNRPVDGELLALFLSACAVRREDGEDERVLELTRRLTEAAPGHSVAHSLRATVAAQSASRRPSGSAEAQSLLSIAHASATKALELDPRNGEAHLARGAAYYVVSNWMAAEAELLQAEALSPDLRAAPHYRAGFLRAMGRMREALALNERAIVTDTFSSAQLSNLAIGSMAFGQPSRAEEVLRRLALINPEAARQARMSIAIFLAPPREGRRTLLALAPGHAPADELACLSMYLERLAAAQGRPIRGVPWACGDASSTRARLLARQGDIDGAYEAIPSDPDQLRGQITLLYRPEMKAFRQDPRFMLLAQRLGLADYWLRSGKWPDFCAEPDLPYDCATAARATGRGALSSAVRPLMGGSVEPGATEVGASIMWARTWPS